jgi:hypothetical protein
MEIPDYFEKIGFHFSPYQTNLPNDVWMHNYIFRDADWRSQRILHPRVEGGKAVEVGLVHYATNEQDEAAAIQVALKQFRKAKIHYSSGTWKDSYERMIDEIPLVVLQGIYGEGSFYSKATNKEPIILCANDQQCRIFRYLPDDKQNPDHCQSLSPVKVDLFLKQFQIIQQVRQNWLQMSTNPYQLAKIITPDFSSWYWNDLDEEEFEEAVGLWKNI